MSTAATLTTQQHALTAGPELYRFSVAQYLKLVEQGFFDAEPRIELINGLVVRKMTRYAPHDSTLCFLTMWLVRLLPDAWRARCQLGLVLARSVLEPDLAIVRGPGSRYRRRHPRGADTFLVIEVAEDSLSTDRSLKGAAYAEARIPEYWIVNVVDFQVEVYTQPRGGKTPGYRQRQNYTGCTSVPLILDGQAIARLALTDLFGELLPH